LRKGRPKNVIKVCKKWKLLPEIHATAQAMGMKVFTEKRKLEAFLLTFKR
jgi:hypothetical protein